MGKRDPIPKKLVIVVWEDIVAHAGWTGSVSESRTEVGTMTCVTVGWVVEETEDRLLIADSFTRDHDCGGITALPMRVVSEVVEIESGTSPVDYMKRRPTKRKPPGKETT